MSNKKRVLDDHEDYGEDVNDDSDEEYIPVEANDDEDDDKPRARKRTPRKRARTVKEPGNRRIGRLLLNTIGITDDSVLEQTRKAFDMMDVIIVTNKKNIWELRYCKKTDMLTCFKKLEDSISGITITKGDSDMYNMEPKKEPTPDEEKHRAKSIVVFDISRVALHDRALCSNNKDDDGECDGDGATFVEVPGESLVQYLDGLKKHECLKITRESSERYNIRTIPVDINDLADVLDALTV